MMAAERTWPALVLTAGLGTRLRPLSAVRAKPAMPVAGRPLVLRILDWLAFHGIRDAVLNLHHRPDTITGVVGDGSALGLRVRYSWEDPILGSAGGPRQALPLLDAPRFFVINGDTLTDVDLGALADSHEASGALATLALIGQPDASHYGGVNLAPDGTVSGFVRRGTPSTYHFIGVQAVNAEAFEPVACGAAAETIGWLYPRLLSEAPGSVRGFPCSADFHDIGTSGDYLATSLACADTEGRPDALIGSGCVIDRSALVDKCVLWDRVVIESGGHLRRCVLADDVRIPAGASFEHAAIIARSAGYVPDPADEILGNLVVRRFQGDP